MYRACKTRSTESKRAQTTHYYNRVSTANMAKQQAATQGLNAAFALTGRFCPSLQYLRQANICNKVMSQLIENSSLAIHNHTCYHSMTAFCTLDQTAIAMHGVLSQIYMYVCGAKCMYKAGQLGSMMISLKLRLCTCSPSAGPWLTCQPLCLQISSVRALLVVGSWYQSNLQSFLAQVSPSPPSFPDTACTELKVLMLSRQF